MEQRAYFIAGDLTACAATGALAGWLAWLAVPAGWAVLLGMVLGMLAGIIAGMIGGVLFSPLFGGFEIMLPASLAGMMAGMILGMAEAVSGIGALQAAAGGAAVGLACLAYTYFLQARHHGEVT